MKRYQKFAIILFALGLGLLGTSILTGGFKKEKIVEISPIAKINKKAENLNPFKVEPTNILLVGTDISNKRRSEGQFGFNTDTMILVSINPTTNKVLLTSVPRDLWINGGKINSLYITQGQESLVDAFEQITGREIDGVITADFDDFTWIVDAFGGVPVDVQRTFTDFNFPNGYGGVNPVTFTQGTEVMDGERALTFARSRKGNNGEGSDLMRAKRQHLLLEGMVEAVKQPESIFWPMNVEYFYKTVTAPTKMETTLSLKDVTLLWDLYMDKDLYTIESFVVDDEYVYHPGMYPQSQYTAWVFVPINPGFEQLHRDIMAKLGETAISGTQTHNDPAESGSDI